MFYCKTGENETFYIVVGFSVADPYVDQDLDPVSDPT